MNKFQFIQMVAMNLYHEGSTLIGNQLVPLLNEAGYKTNRGGPFKVGRGVYRLISASFKRAKSEKAATAIASSFLNLNGEYAFEIR